MITTKQAEPSGDVIDERIPERIEAYFKLVQETERLLEELASLNVFLLPQLRDVDSNLEPHTERWYKLYG